MKYTPDQPVARVLTRSGNVVRAEFGNVIMVLGGGFNVLVATRVSSYYRVRQTWRAKDLVSKRKRTYRVNRFGFWSSLR